MKSNIIVASIVAIIIAAASPAPAAARGIDGGPARVSDSADGNAVECRTRRIGPSHHGFARDRFRNCGERDQHGADASECERGNVGPRRTFARMNGGGCTPAPVDRAASYAPGHP